MRASGRRVACRSAGARELCSVYLFPYACVLRLRPGANETLLCMCCFALKR